MSRTTSEGREFILGSVKPHEHDVVRLYPFELMNVELNRATARASTDTDTESDAGRMPSAHHFAKQINHHIDSFSLIHRELIKRDEVERYFGRVVFVVDRPGYAIMFES
jgi:hypothetical protein